MEKVIGEGYKNDGLKYGTQTKAIVVLDKKRQAHYRLTEFGK